MTPILISIAFAFAFPIGLIIWWNSRHKGNIWPFFAGMICFTLFAMGLEQIPHYLCLVKESAISKTINGSAILFTLYASFAAGIFEETGRLFGYKVLLRKRTDMSNAVGYGIGHGGVEVLFVFGITYIMYLLASLGVSFGDAATDEALAWTIGKLSVGNALVAMLERISAMMIHVGLSMIMFKAVKEKGKLWLYPVSICLHALADVPAALYRYGILQSLLVVELFAFIMGIGCLLLGRKILQNEDTIIETNRIKIYAASNEQMERFIREQSVDVLKAAYTEMLDGCRKHPEQWKWYAIWMIELKDGTHVGEMCFKGLNADGSAEIGYGIADEYQGKGYATEAVSALVNWAFSQPGVKQITAETEESNLASIKVLQKAGFLPTGERGEEGLLFIRNNNFNLNLWR